jgi:hypothetical protein
MRRSREGQMTGIEPGVAAAEAPSQVDDVAMPTAELAVRRTASEDWIATIVGLVLLGLAIAGVITKAMIP